VSPRTGVRDINVVTIGYCREFGIGRGGNEVAEGSCWNFEENVKCEIYEEDEEDAELTFSNEFTLVVHFLRPCVSSSRSSGHLSELMMMNRMYLLMEEKEEEKEEEAAVVARDKKLC
jgi:hypothetical protein